MECKKSVLIADDDEMLLRALKRRCEALGLQVNAVTSGAAATKVISGDPPDLLILDIEMPAGDGLSVVEKICADNGVTPIPAIFLTGSSEQDTVRYCESLGAQYVLKDANAWETLEPAICKKLGLTRKKASRSSIAPAAPIEPAASHAAPTVLAIDDDPHILQALKIRLKSVGALFIGASDSKTGYMIALNETPDVIITDYMMPGSSGDYLIQRLRTCPATQHIPVIMITGKTYDGGNEDIGLKRRITGQEGVVAYLQKPIEFEELYDVLRKTLGLDLKDYTPPTPQPAAGRAPVRHAEVFGRRNQSAKP